MVIWFHGRILIFIKELQYPILFIDVINTLRLSAPSVDPNETRSDLICKTRLFLLYILQYRKLSDF